MKAISSGAAARERSASEAKPDKNVDAAWNVLEAANDLGDTRHNRRLPARDRCEPERKGGLRG
jgi:hypothetical protein